MIKTLAKYIKGYEIFTVITPICMILEVIMEMIVPNMMASIIDNGVNGNGGKGDMAHIFIMGACMLLAALFGVIAGIGGGVFGAKASTGFAKNLRAGMFRNIQTYSFANIDKFSTAGLITRLTTDVTNIQNAFQMLLRMCMRSPVSIIVAMVMSFATSKKLASIYLIAVILLGCVLFVIVKMTMKYFEQVFKKYDALNESVQENVSAIRVVKAYVREEHEKEKFNTASQNVYKMFVKAESLIALNSPIMMFTVNACILLISWFGANMIVSEELSTGELMKLLTYCLMILMNLMMLSMIFVMMTMSAASGRRIAEVLNEESSIVNPENPTYEIKDGSVVFDNVTFSYNKENKEAVLKNINIDIKAGETVGIIGATGSAKTSLVNLISRLYDVTEGSVKVGGIDVREYDLETLRNQVSVVLQNNVLFSGTILDNLRWGDENATEEDCIRVSKLACADEFINKFPDGYDTWIEQGGTNVSGGQKQRLCIARALLKKPKVLILDNSTSAVDTATDAKIRRAFREEIPNTTKFIISQRVASVMDADKIIVMEDGMIDGFGSHDELLESNEIYREIFECQTQGDGDFDENGGDN